MQQHDVHGAAVVPVRLKLVVAGGFGAGKTTFVRAVSEIPPLSTEELLTEASSSVDSLSGVRLKKTTTVAMDFGRITFPAPDNVQLLLFGTPGQDRFHVVWEDLASGALGAVVLVDTRRLEDSFTTVGFFEQKRLPFVVAVNEFDTAPHRYKPEEVRNALDLPTEIPVLLCDARASHSCADVLITLTTYALSMITQPVLGASR
ncbi:ATP/GTP-binding protein [Streptomyces sp. NPDC059118]|uniref:GTP-binding protein n=1 Tax=unclassified Streptomyces TaxID=2593676 RepID=UPI0036B6C274